jgi:hypothetical protein
LEGRLNLAKFVAILPKADVISSLGVLAFMTLNRHET